MRVQGWPRWDTVISSWVTIPHFWMLVLVLGHRATRLSLLIRVEQKGYLVKQEPGHQDLASHPLCCLSSKSEMNSRVTSDSHWRCCCGAGGPAAQQGWVLIRRLDSIWQARFYLGKAKALNSTFACFWSFCNYSKSWWRGLLNKKNK